ncbi:anti-sigma factor [Devosia sp. FJ2-5-3]|uniref:anti-sigma factor n=1 Tax=Devosia sp. FJ2-5-3 TaxID=2976680 RepID=UPI0023D876DF|nr:anti-sigma factor [Devosia sp. FJ2-5-3]WEJ59188.1 anti-sigma factor [Devosia sp. FJ2-5-3]
MSTGSQDSKGQGGSPLVAEYVLGLLDSAEHLRVEKLIADSPALQKERDFWSARFAALDSEFSEVTPPARTWQSIEMRLFPTPVRASWWDSLALWRGITAGALAIAVAAVGFSLVQPAPDSAALTTQLVAALRAEGSDVQFVALYDGSGAVRLTALSGSEIPDRDYELWAIQGGGAPVSMGIVPVNARSVVELSPAIQAGWGEGSVLAITLEPKGGAPNGIATGPIVAQGAVTRI